MAALGHHQPMKETRVFRARQFALAGKTLVFFIADTACTATLPIGQMSLSSPLSPRSSGGGSGSSYATPSATSVSYETGVRSENGQVIISYSQPLSDTTAPVANPTQSPAAAPSLASTAPMCPTTVRTGWRGRRTWSVNCVLNAATPATVAPTR